MTDNNAQAVIDEFTRLAELFFKHHRGSYGVNRRFVMGDPIAMFEVQLGSTRVRYERVYESMLFGEPKGYATALLGNMLSEAIHDQLRELSNLLPDSSSNEK